MTKEDAIEILTLMKRQVFAESESDNALDMAIEALEKTSGCKGCKQTQIHCFDCARKAPDFYKGEEDE